MSILVDAFDAQFSDVDIEIILKLLLAANYMQIDSLVKLMSAKFVSLIKDKNIDEMCDELGISNDYTEEEERYVEEKILSKLL